MKPRQEASSAFALIKQNQRDRRTIKGRGGDSRAGGWLPEVIDGAGSCQLAIRITSESGTSRSFLSGPTIAVRSMDD
jgi:hypothetical protein